MRKFMLVIIMIFSFLGVVDANSISNINMDVMVDRYGNATIIETWDAYVDEGTEGWHPYYNLGESVISNLFVSMDGVEFTTVDNWNVDNSFSEKAYKAGIYYAGDGEYDICFGISRYGNHKYVIKYDISNFVVRLDDADMIYWNLFPYNFSASPNNVDITIYSDFKYSKKVKMWGYDKFGASLYLNNGKIIMSSKGRKLKSNEYMTILVKFPRSTFDTKNEINRSFDYYLSKSREGTVIGLILKFRYIFYLLIGGILVVCLSKVLSLKKVKRVKRFEDNMESVPIVRELPCNKDIFYAYFVAVNYDLIDKKEDFLGTMFLRWIHNGNVKVENTSRDCAYVSLIFDKRPDSKNECEVKLFDYMLEASVDGKLGNNEFKEWNKKNPGKIIGWFDDVLFYESLRLMKEKKIKYDFEGNSKYYLSKFEVLDNSIIEFSKELEGLKKFFEEFTLIDEKAPIEVKLWDEYLMYAQMFGIADEVSCHFEKLYPEVTDVIKDYGCSYIDVLFVKDLSTHLVRYAPKTYSYKPSSARYSSSGSGSSFRGFSSGGGGRGSFGGSGGSSGGRGGGGFR